MFLLHSPRLALAGILVFRLCTDAEKIISGMFRAKKVKKEMFSML